MQDAANQGAASGAPSNGAYGWNNAQVMAQFNGQPLPQMQQADFGWCDFEGPESANPADAG